jgi:hypothetical protein
MFFQIKDFSATGGALRKFYRLVFAGRPFPLLKKGGGGQAGGTPALRKTENGKRKTVF